MVAIAADDLDICCGIDLAENFRRCSGTGNDGIFMRDDASADKLCGRLLKGKKIDSGSAR